MNIHQPAAASRLTSCNALIVMGGFPGGNERMDLIRLRMTARMPVYAFTTNTGAIPIRLPRRPRMTDLLANDWALLPIMLGFIFIALELFGA